MDHFQTLTEIAKHSNTKNTASCNTKARGRCWALTINNYDDGTVERLNLEKRLLKKYAWQSEVGDSGTEHLQVALNYTNACTFESLKKKFPTAHIEKCRNWAASFNYCKKSNTADGKVEAVSEGDDVANKYKLAKDPLEGRTLRRWQEKIIELIQENPDDRTIYWFWEEVGNVGKTTLAKHIVTKYTGALYLTGKAGDMKYGITKYIDQTKQAPRIILVNIPRSVEHVSYNGIEQIKDGIFFNTKYECAMVTFDSPHIFIFANEKPLSFKMSADRWKIINLETW